MRPSFRLHGASVYSLAHSYGSHLRISLYHIVYPLQTSKALEDKSRVLELLRAELQVGRRTQAIVARQY